MAACATSSSSSAARNSCVAQFNKWRAGGGQAAFLAVGRAVGRYGRAASVLGSSGVSAATVSQLRLAAADLLTAVHSAQANPPPACVPGLRSTSGMALADFARAARAAETAVHAVQANDAQGAVKDIRASTIALVAGARAIKKTDQDIQRFESSN